MNKHNSFITTSRRRQLSHPATKYTTNEKYVAVLIKTMNFHTGSESGWFRVVISESTQQTLHKSRGCGGCNWIWRTIRYPLQTPLRIPYTLFDPHTCSFPTFWVLCDRLFGYDEDLFSYLHIWLYSLQNEKSDL